MRFLFCDPAATATIAECLSVFLVLALLWRLITVTLQLAQWHELEFFERLFDALISDSFLWSAFFFILEAFLWFVVVYPHYSLGTSRVFEMVIPFLLGGLEKAYFFWSYTGSPQRGYFPGFYAFLMDRVLFLLFQERGAVVAYSKFRWAVTAIFFVWVAAFMILPRVGICMSPLFGGIYIWLLLLSLYYSGLFVAEYLGALIRRR